MWLYSTSFQRSLFVFVIPEEASTNRRWHRSPPPISFCWWLPEFFCWRLIVFISLRGACSVVLYAVLDSEEEDQTKDRHWSLSWEVRASSRIFMRTANDGVGVITAESPQIAVATRVTKTFVKGHISFSVTRVSEKRHLADKCENIRSNWIFCKFRD